MAMENESSICVCVCVVVASSGGGVRRGRESSGFICLVHLEKFARDAFVEIIPVLINKKGPSNESCTGY